MKRTFLLVLPPDFWIKRVAERKVREGPTIKGKSKDEVLARRRKFSVRKTQQMNLTDSLSLTQVAFCC